MFLMGVDKAKHSHCIPSTFPNLLHDMKQKSRLVFFFAKCSPTFFRLIGGAFLVLVLKKVNYSFNVYILFSSLEGE